jgi:endonuclease/exonuclease/phosphatase family metal-dependent hydrolase
MTYNIRYDNPNDGENKWDLRKHFLSQQIQFYSPDILGIQEGKLHQLRYLDSILSHYSYIGRGRDNSENQGEYCAIFFNKNKFKILNESTFWLSETPNKVSKGWDANIERICTYALFEIIQTKQKFYVLNTHFDHIGAIARENSAKLIIEKINAINTQNYPVILTGDFNSEPNSNTYLYLSKYLNDTRFISKSIAFGPEGTFNNFEFHKPVITLIDYIFTSKNNIKVDKFAVLSDAKNCKYPSDHLPVYAELSLIK